MLKTFIWAYIYRECYCIEKLLRWCVVTILPVHTQNKKLQQSNQYLQHHNICMKSEKVQIKSLTSVFIKNMYLYNIKRNEFFLYILVIAKLSFFFLAAQLLILYILNSFIEPAKHSAGVKGKWALVDQKEVNR